jgi:hypothetical protein
MGTMEQATATFERNIEEKTGAAIPVWIKRLAAAGIAMRHGPMVAWLKAEHGFSHSHANHVAKRATEAAAPRSDEDPVAHLFEGGKEGLRPIYEALVALVSCFGADVEIAPKKANVSIRRRKQFALFQPSTRTRLDVGLILKNRSAARRLEQSGSFNAMFTHRVKLSSAAEVDDELGAWLKEAYDEAL